MGASAKLPIEVKRLVNAGVYSIYSVKGYTFLVLVTDRREHYLLSPEGEPFTDAKFADLASIPLGDSITFPDIGNTGSIKVNYAA